MIYLYRFFYGLLRFLVQGIKPLLSPSLQSWINLRQSPPLQNRSLADLPTLPRPQEVRLLFHASSGEIEYVKALIRELKTQRPSLKIYVSYSSPSAEKLFSNIKDCVETFIPLPWDRPRDIQVFLDFVQPQAIVFSRTDFWPEFITQAKRKNIALLGVSLFSATDSLGLLQKIWLHFVLKDFALLTAVTEKTTQSLKDLFPEKEIYFFPDTRFDQVFYRLQQTSKIPEAVSQSLANQKKKIVFGSTWPEDEVIITPCLSSLVEKNFQIIFAPHDVSLNRITSLQKKLQPYKTILFSELLTAQSTKFDILILDRIGYLADMYRHSDYAFVGGSFKSKVHSVMEPLCAGNRVLLGPYHENSPEAMQYKMEPLVASVGSDNSVGSRKFVQIVQNSQEFLMAIDLFNSTAVTKDDIVSEMQKNQGASKSICELIFKKIIR